MLGRATRDIPAARRPQLSSRNKGVGGGVLLRAEGAARTGRGGATALLEAAVATAKRHGAQVVEATSVDPDSPSFRFMGYRSMFRAAGFEDVQPAESRWHGMHRVLSAPLRRRLAST